MHTSISSSVMLEAVTVAFELNPYVITFKFRVPNLAAADTELSSVDAEKLEAFYAQSAGDGRHNFDHPDYADGQLLSTERERQPSDGLLSLIHISRIPQAASPSFPAAALNSMKLHTTANLFTAWIPTTISIP